MLKTKNIFYLLLFVYLFFNVGSCGKKKRITKKNEAFGSSSKGNNNKNEENSKADFVVSGDEVVEISKCYINEFYKEINELDDKISEMNSVINAHLAFSGNIKECITNQKKMLNINNLRNELFKDLDKWLADLIGDDKTKGALIEDYNEQIEKYWNNQMDEWVNWKKDEKIRNNNSSEKFEEISKKFNLWVEQNPNAKLNDEFIKENEKEYKSWTDLPTNELNEIKVKYEKDLYNKALKMKELYVNEKENLEKFNVWKNANLNGKIVKFYVEDMELKFNAWRRKLSPMSLSLNSAYLYFAKQLIDKLVQLIENKEDEKSKQLYKTLNGMSQRMNIEIDSNLSIAEKSFLSRKHISNFEKFNEPYKKLIEDLKQVKVKINNDFVPNEKELKFPKVKRVIWFVRHGERFDNNEDNKKEAKTVGHFKKQGKQERKLALDNSHLNEHGIKTAKLLEPVFANIYIKHIFSSPYERTVETALFLLGEGHRTFNGSKRSEIVNELKLKVEPGFIEKLRNIEKEINGNPNGYEECEQLKEHHLRLNCNYRPLFNRNMFLEYKEIESRVSDISALPRLKKVLNLLFTSKTALSDPFIDTNAEGKMKQKLKEKIVSNGHKIEWLQPEEENAEHIVIVSHGKAISSVQQIINGKFTFVPQASITKVVQLEGHDQLNVENPLKNLRLIFGGATKHLGENLDKKIYFDV
ncbi:hypothetical protein Mgra_00009996 [Meloidogyne graminicola]|uniref:Phosphoglycerate mutase n=1 Tax=Meloidogyne graminicola TaxID=189291 RepID=A0A8S9ZCU0_9BILA|nr:hypothetical protein Mgra_00009996 [Meloidogyne graminicola]